MIFLLNIMNANHGGSVHAIEAQYRERRDQYIHGSVNFAHQSAPHQAVIPKPKLEISNGPGGHAKKSVRNPIPPTNRNDQKIQIAPAEGLPQELFVAARRTQH